MSARRAAAVWVLPQGADEAADEPFARAAVKVDLGKDAAVGVLDKAGVRRGFLCHGGRIIDDSAPAKSWYDLEGAGHPLIAVEVRGEYIETDEARLRNPAARVVAAGVAVPHALRALGRAAWHPGFGDFAQCAVSARALVVATGKEEHGRARVCASVDPWGGVGHVAPFRGAAELLLPPCAAGHLSPPQVRGVWYPSFDFSALSAEERAGLQRRGRAWHHRRRFIERAAGAVVRVWGFHPFDAGGDGGAGGGDPEGTFDELHVDASGDRFDAVPFTAFFVAPRLLLATRACGYSERRQTYASHYMFATNTHAQLGMLREGDDLWRCREVQGVTEFIARKMRGMGYELPVEKVPSGNMAVPWNDLMLLEVDPPQKSEVYLLPDGAGMEKGGDVVTVAYHGRPDEQWMDETFGPRGHGTPLINERVVGDVFWGFDRKCASLGEALITSSDDDGLLPHTCSLLPGALGGPLLARFEPRTASAPDGRTVDIITFAGVTCGRTAGEIDEKVAGIEASSTGEAAARLAKSLNMYNNAMSVRHLTFTLVYQEYVAPRFVGLPEEGYLNEFLRRYRIFVEPELLSSCHRKMLMDAEDCNAWGQDFHKAHDVDSALCCFRAGARMFSIATIPDITPQEQRLKDALQANVAAVVMVQKDSGPASSA